MFPVSVSTACVSLFDLSHLQISVTEMIDIWQHQGDDAYKYNSR